MQKGFAINVRAPTLSVGPTHEPMEVIMERIIIVVLFVAVILLVATHPHVGIFGQSASAEPALPIVNATLPQYPVTDKSQCTIEWDNNGESGVQILQVEARTRTNRFKCDIAGRITKFKLESDVPIKGFVIDGKCTDTDE